MSNQNQKPKSKGKYLLAAIGWLACALIFLAAFGFGFSNGYKYLFNGATSYEDMIAEHGSLQKGEYVSVDANAVVDWYAETKYKINGIIPAGSKQHCLLWVDNSTFVSLTVKGSENKEKINRLIDQTYSYLNYETDELPETIRFEGEVTSIGSEVSKYYDEILSNWQISGDPDLKVYYLTIDTTSTKASIIGYSVFGLAMIIIFIVLFISNIKGFKNFGKVNAQPASGQGMAPMSGDNVFGNMYNAQNTYAGNTDANAYGQNNYAGNTGTNAYGQNMYNGNTNADMYSQNAYTGNTNTDTYSQNTYGDNINTQNNYADNTNNYATDDDDEKTVLISGMSFGYTEDAEKNLKE